MNLRSQNQAASSLVLKRQNQPIQSRGARGGGLNTASLAWMLKLHRVCPARPSPWEQRQRVQRDGPRPSPGWGSRRREFCVRAWPFASVGARALWLGGWDAQSIQEISRSPRNALGSTPILTGGAWWSPCVQREVSKLSQLPDRLAHCLVRSQGAPWPTWAKPVWLSALNPRGPSLWAPGEPFAVSEGPTCTGGAARGWGTARPQQGRPP